MMVLSLVSFVAVESREIGGILAREDPPDALSSICPFEDYRD
jgi:hypothetical protein